MNLFWWEVWWGRLVWVVGGVELCGFCDLQRIGTVLEYKSSFKGFWEQTNIFWFATWCHACVSKNTLGAMGVISSWSWCFGLLCRSWGLGFSEKRRLVVVLSWYWDIAKVIEIEEYEVWQRKSWVWQQSPISNSYQHFPKTQPHHTTVTTNPNLKAIFQLSLHLRRHFRIPSFF